MLKVYMITLLLRPEGAEFELRVGTVVHETFEHIKVMFKTKSNKNNPVLIWKKYSGTPYNFIVSYPDRITMMLNTDNDNVVDEAVDTISKYADKKYKITETIAKIEAEKKEKERLAKEELLKEGK